MERGPPRKGWFWVLGELTGSHRRAQPGLPLLGALSWREAIPRCLALRPLPQGRLGRTPHLVSERRLELADEG